MYVWSETVTSGEELRDFSLLQLTARRFPSKNTLISHYKEVWISSSVDDAEGIE